MTVCRAKDGPAVGVVLQRDPNTDTDPEMGPEMGLHRGLEDRTRTGADPDHAGEEIAKEISEDQEIDFVTLGMFIIGVFFSFSSLIEHTPHYTTQPGQC